MEGWLEHRSQSEEDSGSGPCPAKTLMENFEPLPIFNQICLVGLLEAKLEVVFWQRNAKEKEGKEKKIMEGGRKEGSKGTVKIELGIPSFLTSPLDNLSTSFSS